MKFHFSNKIICRISFCLLFIFFANTVFAQSKMQIIEMEKEADAYYKTKNFHSALPVLLKLDSLKPGNAEYIYTIGVCYIAIDDNINALKYLEKYLSVQSNPPVAFNYYIGRSYHLSHRFDEAIKYYTLYQNEFRDKKNKNTQALVQEVDRDIEMCKNGKELLANPLAIEIKNLGPEINSSYPEYGPVISADESELIFTSNRPNTTGGRVDNSDGLFYEDVYISYKKDGRWTEPLQMSTSINTDNHDASIAISPDGQTLFLYRFEQDSPFMKSSGDLFISKLSGKAWGKAEKLSDKINSKYWEPSASVTEDGKILFFTSDKPEGEGGTDIYYSRKLSDGDWDKPQSIGKNINTKYDEDCPFIHPDGKTLYFSSKGHKSMGGFDIFISKWDSEKNEWGKPENIGYPISTAQDDLHFAISTDAKRVYFSTTRPEGYGNKDIYFADLIKQEAAKVLLISGIVRDSATQMPLEVTIRISDKNKDEEVGIYKSNSSTGKYTLVLNQGKNYDVLFTSPKAGSHYENIDLTKTVEYKEVEKNIIIKPKKRDVMINISDAETNNGLKAKIKLMNLDSKEVINVDEESGTDGQYKLNLKEGNIYNTEINKFGYVFYNKELMIPSSERINDSLPIFLVKLLPIKQGASLILKNIYFATDEAKPLETSNEEIIRVSQFMKLNPSAIIEISAHTDDVGDNVYNQKLSEKRAQEVVNKLVSLGISPSKLVAKGYGKTKPVNTGSSDADRAQNRRVELKIIQTK